MNTSSAIPIVQHLREREEAFIRKVRYDLNGGRHDEMLINTILGLGLLGGMAASSLLLMVGNVPEVVPPAIQEAIRHAASIMDDDRLLAACALGSFGGGILSTLLFPLGHPREYAAKIFGSAIAGIMFSPKILSWFAWEPNTANVVFMAGAVALLSWSCLQPLVPMVPSLVRRFANKWAADKLKTDP